MIDEKIGQLPTLTESAISGGLANMPTPDRALYYGDNLEILRKYGRDDSVDLCYMDPPFNSKRSYSQIYNNVGSDDLAQSQAFIDTWTWNERARVGFSEILSNPDGRFQPQLIELIRGLHRVLGESNLFAYLVAMSLVATEIQRVLKPSGSFYLHCDPTASHYLKLAIDSIFCSQGGDFRNEIIWRRTGSHNAASRFGPIHDVILYYVKSDDAPWNEQLQPYSDKYKEHFGKIDEATQKQFQDVTLTGPGKRNGPSGQSWRGFDPTKKGRHWQPATYVYTKYKQITGEELNQYPLLKRLDRLDEIGLIYWPKKEGGQPRYKLFLEDNPGVPLQDVWNDIDPVNSQAAERIGYPTQKPLTLLERIILASSNKGDVVMDPCCGCGTTIAAAELRERKWVGIDITYQAISVILQRLEDQSGEAWPAIEKKIVLSGIPRDMDSAKALAHKRDDRVRKEFEKWAVLTFTNNRAVINEKKGADAGIDGKVYFLTGKSESATMVLQVKSGIVGRGDVAKLRGDMEREGAAMATLITLANPTAPMVAEAKAAGLYRHELMERDYNRIEIVTVKEMIEDNRRLDIPLVKGKAAPAPKRAKAHQTTLDLDAIPEPVADVTDMLDHLRSGSGKSNPAQEDAARASRPMRKGPKNAPRSETKKKGSRH